jgi:hypothetical protein
METNSNFDRFIAVYTAQLQHEFDTNPEYALVSRQTSAHDLAVRMTESLMKGSASKDGRAIKSTCNALGIKYTYKAIVEYLKG